MAYKLVNKTQLDYDLERIANAIRSKGSASGRLTFPDGMINAINNLTFSSLNSISIPSHVVASGSANYQLVDADILDGYITQVTNTLRNRTGYSKKLSFPNGIIGLINAISATEEKVILPAGVYQWTNTYANHDIAITGSWSENINGFAYCYYDNILESSGAINSITLEDNSEQDPYIYWQVSGDMNYYKGYVDFYGANTYYIQIYNDTTVSSVFKDIFLELFSLSALPSDNTCHIYYECDNGHWQDGAPYPLPIKQGQDFVLDYYLEPGYHGVEIDYPDGNFTNYYYELISEGVARIYVTAVYTDGMTVRVRSTNPSGSYTVYYDCINCANVNNHQSAGSAQTDSNGNLTLTFYTETGYLFSNNGGQTYAYPPSYTNVTEEVLNSGMQLKVTISGVYEGITLRVEPTDHV